MPNGAKHWCFTLNNPTAEEEERLASIFAFDVPIAEFLIYGRETGAHNTPHLQGYICFKSRKTLLAVKEVLSTRVHAEVRRGSVVQAISYCRKDGDYVEFGEVPADQGHRSDIDRYQVWLREQTTIPSETTIAANFFSLWMRYPRQCLRARDLFCPTPPLETGEPKNWQRILLSRSLEVAPDRTIMFLVDTVGGVGKSWVMRKLLTDLPDDVQVLGIGKTADLAHAIDITKRIFVFDIPRGGMEYLSYATLEKLKDRVIFSSKYDSCMKVLKAVPHVFVFTNEYPDMEKMTADRYLIVDEFDNISDDDE